jgi:hypothetical protein
VLIVAHTLGLLAGLLCQSASAASTTQVQGYSIHAKREQEQQQNVRIHNNLYYRMPVLAPTRCGGYAPVAHAHHFSSIGTGDGDDGVGANVRVNLTVPSIMECLRRCDDTHRELSHRTNTSTSRCNAVLVETYAVARATAARGHADPHPPQWVGGCKLLHTTQTTQTVATVRLPSPSPTTFLYRQGGISTINRASRLHTPLIHHLFVADPSARVFNGELYIYASHDLNEVDPVLTRGAGEFAMHDSWMLRARSINSRFEARCSRF